MNKQREALELALNTLRGWIGIDEWIWPVTAKETCKKNSLEAIAAIREALAEQEPEPVAWMTASTGDLHTLRSHKVFEAGDVPLYAAPSSCKPLTDEQLCEIAKPFVTVIGGHWENDYGIHERSVEDFARAIERAHGIGAHEHHE